ncbi:hypothetical protein TWF718_001814 [Orbilia javanica]|uniref:Uncharacterized protein n=1 Tax=Orbilia javanica TaxID=47235 RepID=A0AAN8P2Y5_9PEZI
MASRILKRIRRKPTSDSNNSGLEAEAPPPYRYNENATISTIDVVKPFASYVENMAVEDVNLAQRRMSEVVPVSGGVKGQENSEARRTSLESVSVEGRGGLLESEALGREGRALEQFHREVWGRGRSEAQPGYETFGGRLPEAPVPPPPPPPSTASVFQNLPPPRPPKFRVTSPPPLPPKEPPNSPISLPSTPKANFETESIHATHGTETTDGTLEGDEDDGNSSDASDDSFVIARYRSISQQQEFDDLNIQKMNIAGMVDTEQWDWAYHLLNELIQSIEERKEKVPAQWYLELVRLGIRAGAPVEDLQRLPDIKEETDGESDQQRKLRMECMVLEGILASKRGDDKASTKWFLKGAKFARKHNIIREMIVCYGMLKTNYEKSGDTKQMEVYESLTPGFGTLSITEYLRPRVFRLDAVSKSVRQEECLRLLDGLLLRKDVAEDEGKKEKYRQVLLFLSACKGRYTVSPSIIADIYGIETTEILRMINSASSIFKEANNVDSDVEVIDELLGSIVCRNSKSPSAAHDYFSYAEPLVLSDLLRRLLALMNRLLTEDICGIKMYGTPMEQIAKEDKVKSIRASLEFACHQWLSHFMHAKSELPLNELQTFVEEHWLQWIELIGLFGAGMLKRISRMTQFMRLNPTAKKKVQDLPPAMARKIESLEPFLKRYGEKIIEMPLQVYYLWRFFDFEESSVSPSTPKVHAKVDIHDSQNQDDTFKALSEGYKDLLTVVKPGENSQQKFVFSSDLRLVAYSVLNSPIIIVKDLMKKSDGIILEHGQERIYEIYFSPKVAEDNILAMITNPTQLMIWDISRAKATHKATYYPELRNQHLKISFSQDGKLIAFLYSRTKVVVRRVDTGEIAWNILDNRPDPILGLSFQPDSSGLAIVDIHGTLKTAKSTSNGFIEPGTGRVRIRYLQKLENASVHVLDEEKKGVLMWTKTTGVQIKLLGVGDPIVLEAVESKKKKTVVVVSPNGRRIAAIQDKGGIQIFDTATRKCIQSFWRLNQVYGETTLAAAFLPSGDRLITISKEMGVRVWELTVDMEIEDGWVVRGDEKVMWIPENYHARIADAERSNLLVLTHPSGRVLEIEFGIDKGRVFEGGGAYELVSNVMAYLPSLPKGLPSLSSLSSLPRSLPTFGWGSVGQTASSSSSPST